MYRFLSVMNEIEIVSGYPAISQLSHLWDEASAHRRIGAFEGFDLVCRASKAASEASAEPLIVVFRQSGKAVSLLALRAERLMGMRVAVALAHPFAQYTDVVGAPLAPADLDRACALLAACGLNLLLLRKVRADSGLHEALAREGRSQGAADTALFIDLAAYESMATYEAAFSSTTRRNRRQRRQKLEALAGPISFAVLRGAEALPAFDTALAWKRDWLAERGIRSPVFDGGAWERLLRSMVFSGDAILSTLRAGNHLAAVEVGFANDDTYIAYLGAYAPEFSSGSPGQEQMRRTIAWCFEQGFSRYDLLAPADDYKRQWARKETGVAIDDYAVALTVLGRGVAEVRRHARPIARDLYLRLSPQVRAAGERYGKPAAAAAAVAALCAGAVLEAMS